MIRALISLMVVFFVAVAALVAIDLYGPASLSITVIDGDTVERAGVRHRLIGIDAPEISEAKCAKEAALGRAAARRLREMIETAHNVDLWPEGDAKDIYGRPLAHLLIDGRDAGDILIAEGLAHPYLGRESRGGWC